MSQLHRDSPRAEPWHNQDVSQWNDWRWQLKNRVRTLSGLESWMHITDDAL